MMNTTFFAEEERPGRIVRLLRLNERGRATGGFLFPFKR
jgi:hypothetical protein